MSSKRPKYGNKKITIDGIIFDSRREADVYRILAHLAEQGTIADLVVHPKWELIPKITESVEKKLKTKTKIIERTIQLPITYTADFKFAYQGTIHVIDVKISPHLLPKEYILKKKMMRYFHRIDIQEVYKPSDINIPINPVASKPQTKK